MSILIIILGLLLVALLIGGAMCSDYVPSNDRMSNTEYYRRL